MNSEKTENKEQGSENLKESNQQQAEEVEGVGAGSVSDRSEPTARQGLTVSPDTPSKTQGVKPPRDSGVGMLGSAAKKAARSNSRADVHEYMRLRRNFV